MARPVDRLVRAMLALGTPWGLWVALPETESPLASALKDFYDTPWANLRDVERTFLAALPADEPVWSERSQWRSWARFHPFIHPEG